jgi:hypothetical protein
VAAPYLAAVATGDDRRRDLAVAAAAIAAVAVPFLAVRHAPIADLPQQVAQVRLLSEAWSGPSAPYRVEAVSPNRLSYALLGGAWLAFGPEHAGRVAMLAVGVLWIAAALALRRRLGRPREAVLAAAVLFFNHTTYWGFYSFSLGLPAFVLFLLGAEAAFARPTWPRRAALAGAALVLLLAHVLWLAAGAAWLVVAAAALRGPRAALCGLAVVAAPLAWAWRWSATLRGSALDGPAAWTDPALRLRAEWLVDATLGGLRGSFEAAVAGALAAWLVGGAVRAARARRRARALGHLAVPPAARDRWDPPLAIAAALLAAGALLLPESTHNTIRFAARWLPMAAFLAVLAAPAPARRGAVGVALAAALAAGVASRTAGAWRAFERAELSGLEESLAALPPFPRVLGLDLVKESEVVRGRPFLQTFAWAQVARGGGLAFSFAVFPSSLVRWRGWRPEPWTPNLVWHGERARREDAEHFGFVLVNAGEARHARVAEELGLAPVTAGGRWRLYRVGPRPERHVDAAPAAPYREREGP